MTVSELIDILKTMRPDSPVHVTFWDDGLYGGADELTSNEVSQEDDAESGWIVYLGGRPDENGEPRE